MRRRAAVARCKRVETTGQAAGHNAKWGCVTICDETGTGRGLAGGVIRVQQGVGIAFAQQVRLHGEAFKLHLHVVEMLEIC